MCKLMCLCIFLLQSLCACMQISLWASFMCIPLWDVEDLRCTISMIKALWFIFHHLTTGRVQTLIYSLILFIVLAQRWVWHFSAECSNVFLIGAGLWATQCFTHASLWNWEHVHAKKRKQMFATKHVQVVDDKPPMHMTCINSSRATCFWN